jgi:hypothetical protein
MTATRYQRMIIQNGLAVCLLGLFGGFIFLFNLLGEISFSPIPITIAYEIPGDPARWRPVHTGNIMNGLMIIVFALILPMMRMSERTAKFVAYGLCCTVWGNAAFYIFGALAPNRGLSIGANKHGDASVAGLLAFWPAIIVAFVLITAIIIMLRSLPKNDQS